jgi:hypothetical protein
MSAGTDPLSTQVGGSHYKNFAIQPIEYIHKNAIGFIAGNIIKRVARYNQPTGKGAEDLLKIIHELDILIDQINKGHEGWVHDRRSDLVIDPLHFCRANNFDSDQTSIIYWVSLYSAFGNGVADLKQAQDTARWMHEGLS